MTRPLHELASEVDVLDLAGAIIVNPVRVRVSTAGYLAMAVAIERCWAVCLEAELLVRALALPEVNNDGRPDEARAAAIAAQATAVTNLMAAMRGEPTGAQS